MTSKRDSALSLAKQGFRVFPLAINGKTPAHARVDWTKTATTDPTRIAEMWTDPVFDSEIDYNIGIALDADTLVVDVDVRDGKKGAESLALLEAIYEPLPDTSRSRTASGGTHYWLTVAGNSGGFPPQLSNHIDLKGEGGYVVAPGSEIDGTLYHWINEPGSGADERGLSGSALTDSAPNHATCPQWLADHATAGRKRNRNDVDHVNESAVRDIDAQSAVARATEWLISNAPEAVEGQNGDNTTVKVINHVGDFGISADMALELVSEFWNETKAIPPWDDGDLEDKVRSAYKSRQNAIGVSAPEAEFEAEQVQDLRTRDPHPKQKGLYFIPWAAAKPDLDQPFLIDDVMDLGAMVVTYGDSNAGKTYVKLDQCFHIAAGRDWNGHKVKQGLVVYVAAEGGKGFQKRIEAFRRHYKVDELPFALIPCPIDLQSERADTGRLIKVIRDAEAHFGQKCVLVVIDTLARAMSGGDENLAADMGKFVEHCDRLRSAIGCTADIIHHTGKDKAKGARGSSALRAATDTEIEIAPGVFTVQKQRDLEKIDQTEFSLLKVEVGHRADGKAVTACVVEWVKVTEFDARVSPAAAEMLALFDQCLDARKEEMIDTEEGDPDTASVAWDVWKMSCLSHFKSPKGGCVSAAYIYKLRRELVTSGQIRENSQKQWVR